MATNIYFAPSYFAPAYFPLLATEQVVPANPPPPVDRALAAYAALLSILEGLGLFESVLFGVTLDQAASSSRTPVATLVPRGWEEADEVDPVDVTRRVSFSIEILVRDDDPFARYGALVSLESAARSAISGNSLGGSCLPALTRIHRVAYDEKSLAPEQASKLEGEFTYIVPTAAPSAATH